MQSTKSVSVLEQRKDVAMKRSMSGGETEYLTCFTETDVYIRITQFLFLIRVIFTCTFGIKMTRASLFLYTGSNIIISKSITCLAGNREKTLLITMSSLVCLQLPRVK